MTPPSLVPASENYGRRPVVESPSLCWYPGAERYRASYKVGRMLSTLLLLSWAGCRPRL